MNPITYTTVPRGPWDSEPDKVQWLDAATRLRRRCEASALRLAAQIRAVESSS
jgi:hypothetical protein